MYASLPVRDRRQVLLCLLLATLMLCSCSATYQQRMQSYETHLYSGHYEKAFNQLDDIKLLKKDRNRFLYLAEKGRAANLLGWYDSSNSFLNEADYFLEDRFKNAGDIAKSNLLNPMMETYRGEDFERFLVHFYKVINYMQLGHTEAAVVEARRIGLANNQLEDAKQGKTGKYDNDAFSLILQGLVYEKAGRINDAFISYRNAANLFLESRNGQLYGVTMPAQLQQDLLRTATQLGFTSDIAYYEKQFGTTYEPRDSAAGELVIFWENGKAPVKQQTNPAYQLLRQEDRYYFVQTGNRQRYDLDESFAAGHYAQLQARPSLLADLFRITLPYYTSSQPYYRTATASIHAHSYAFEEGVDVSALANATLAERQAKEITKALTRLLVKKLTETAAGTLAKQVAMPDNNQKKDADKTPEEKQKEQAKKAQAAAIGNGVELILRLFNTATEKADTRNWQSLPAAIHYVRIPLQAGSNEVKIRFNGPGGITQEQSFSVPGGKGLQVKQISLLQ